MECSDWLEGYCGNCDEVWKVQWDAKSVRQDTNRLLASRVVSGVGSKVCAENKSSKNVRVVAMASRLVLLPTLLLALAFVMLCAPSFVFGGQPASTTSLRSSTARAAVPEALELQTSMTTALEVSTPGWWANIVTLVVPIAILIVLYLQSEKRIYEEQMGKWAATKRGLF